MAKPMGDYAAGLEPRYSKGAEGIRQCTFRVMTGQNEDKHRKETKLFVQK